MKKLLILTLLVSWAFIMKAQLYDKPPYWITNTPTPTNGTFYYRVTIGEGSDYNKAYANAFAKAILESSWKLGVVVKSDNDIKTIEDGIYDNITMGETEMNLPMNKVCEYIEQKRGNTNVRLYILWQVATYGNVTPIFDDYINCK